MAYRGINTVIMMGRLGRDIELKKTQNGKSYCRFSVAVNNGNENGADWFTWTAWNAQAEFLAQYAKKALVCICKAMPEWNSGTRTALQSVYRRKRWSV